MSASTMAASADVVALLETGALVALGADGEPTARHALEGKGEAVARFGEEWLVLTASASHLTKVDDGGAPSVFAAGKGAIRVFSTSRDDRVAVARGASLELWSRDGELAWKTKLGTVTGVALSRDHVLAVTDDGALHFCAREGGELLGALRLASTEPATEWRLTHLDANVSVLALGDWLVWIDASTRKTLRRVRAKGHVRAVSADAAHLVALIEGGTLQVFSATTGEPTGSLAAEDASSVALTDSAIVAGIPRGGTRRFRREELSGGAPVRHAVRLLASRGALTASLDRAGSLRVVSGEPSGLRELSTLAGAEGAVGLSVGAELTVTAATPRAIVRASAPYTETRTLPLKTPPTAFAADDVYAFVGSQTGTVDVLELASGRTITTYALSSDDRITSIVRLPGAFLVVGTGALDGRILIVDVAESKVLHRVSPHEEAFGVTCLVADGRGRILASGSDDGTVVLIEPKSGRVLARIRMPETPVSMAFEPSGRRLACVFGDGTASIVVFSKTGAAVTDLGVRGATSVAWGTTLVLGFKDGHLEGGDRHTQASDAPASSVS
jgi:hypothetical protein